MPLINLDSEINVEHVRPDTGSFYKFVATDAECQLLAARFHFVEVGSLSAELRVCKSARGCWDVSGQLNGEIVQACGATGVPVSETIDFLLEERYVHTVGDPEKVEVHLDEAEPLENGVIKIGEMLAQSLAVAVTPWPRAPEAPDTVTIGEERLDHPFAGLATLKSQLPK
ncbi:hypothetical protein N9315_01530 [Alphaproteobacteria bacterium]|nr:hypothetical protein [Alphaproteobacteria bacterium]